MPLYHPLEKYSTLELLQRLLGSRSPPKEDFNLHQAAKDGDEKAIERALDSGCDIDETDRQGETALQLAASSGCSDTFVLLLESGASAGVPSLRPSFADVCMVAYRLENLGFNLYFLAWVATKLCVPVPFFIAQGIWRKAIAHLIVSTSLYYGSAGFLRWRNPKAFLSAHHITGALSSFKGDTEHMMTLFLDAEPDLEPDDLVALWCQAIERGYTGVCQRLLHAGFPIDLLYCHYEDPDVVTALSHAAGASHLEMVLLLLTNGADPTLLDNHGRSCLAMAVARPYTNHAGPESDADGIVEILLGTEAKKFINAVQKDDDPEVRDFSLAGRYGWPLADACNGLRTIAVRMLLEAGADANLKDGLGQTALHAAARLPRRGAVEIAQLLIDHGADVNSASHNDWTPLGIVVSISSYVDMVDCLLEGGANIEGAAGKETTVLQEAARHDISGGIIIKLLVRRGANVNAIGGRYGSVLLATLQRPCSFVQDASGAITNKSDPQPQIIDFLSLFIKHGLRMDAAPDLYVSAVQLAAERGLPLVISFLLEHGANLPLFNNDFTLQEGKLKQPESSTFRRTTIRQSPLSNVSPFNPEVFRVLLSAGACPDVDSIWYSNRQESTLLGTSCSLRNDKYLTTATLLLEHGADPNFRDLRGHVPMQHAAFAGSLGHLRKLFDFGAGVIIEDDDAFGSLLHSLCKGLVSRGSSPTGREAFLECFYFLNARLPRGTAWKSDGSGRTCLHYLAEMCEETRAVISRNGSLRLSPSSCLPLLLEFLNCHSKQHPLEEPVPNPPLNILLLPDKDGKLAFHLAAQKGDIHVLEGLRNHIVKTAEMISDDWDGSASAVLTWSLLRLADNRGWTALHFAASEGHLLACQYLLDACCDFQGLVEVTESAANLAAEKEQDLAAAYILKYLAIAECGTDEERRLCTSEANEILMRGVRAKLAYEFSQEDLMEAIAMQGRRLAMGRDA